MAREKKKPSWKNSEAKRLLREDIITGAVPSGMIAKDVYEMHAEYGNWPYENFPGNLKRLREKISLDYERMKSDYNAYKHDLALLATLRADQPQVTPWHKSDAKWMLIQDINNGKHKDMKPAELYVTRQEYQQFDLKTFRNHIYQETDSRTKRTFRFKKKEKRSKQADKSKKQEVLRHEQLELAPKAREKLANKGGDVSKLVKKEISAILSIYYKIDTSPSAKKDDLVKQLKEAIQKSGSPSREGDDSDSGSVVDGAN